MGDVVYLNSRDKKVQRAKRRHFSGTEKSPADVGAESLIPIELALGDNDRNSCLRRMALYGVCAIHVRTVKSDPDALLYLINVSDAINFNRLMLEEADGFGEDAIQHIDRIQLLENIQGTLMTSFWSSFTEKSDVHCNKAPS